MRYIKLIIIIFILILVLSTIKALYGFEIPADDYLYSEVELKNNDIVHIRITDYNSAYVVTNNRIYYEKNNIVYVKVYHSLFGFLKNPQARDINIKKSEKTKIYFKGKGQIKHIYG